VDLETAVSEQVPGRVPGLSVLVADSTTTQFERAFGTADRTSARPMEPDTICNWFSMTKLVTATAVVQLADRGVLDLDAPVAEVYEPFEMLRPVEHARRVTVRHLLSHSGGVANPVPLRWVHLASEAGPERSSFVAGLLQKHPKLRFEPGTRASYTNLGYLVLGEVLTRVAGDPFEGHVQANVLQPRGMAATGFVAVDEARWATPYQRRFNPLGTLLPLLVPRPILGPKQGRFRALRHFYLDGAAYGGLVGPATDAVRFLRAHLADGELDGARILSVEAARSMRRIVAHGRAIEVGLGWFRRGRRRPTDFVEHLGGGAGFWSCLRIYPDRGVGAVVMGNSTSYDHHSIVEAALADVA
jgi:CubicO group peptidase (beta-lactamase class C family)